MDTLPERCPVVTRFSLGRLYIRVVASFGGSNVSKLASSQFVWRAMRFQRDSRCGKLRRKGALKRELCDALCYSRCVRRAVLPHGLLGRVSVHVDLRIADV